MTDDPETQLRQQLLLRRTLMGVTAISFGLAALGIGGAMIVLTFQGELGRRGMIRMGFLGLALGVIFLGAGYRTLRHGEIDPDTGKLVPDQSPVPPAMVAAASLVLAAIVSAIAAWPLGLYTWLGTLDSGCRDLLTEAELTRLAGQPIFLDDVSDVRDDLHCAATFADASGAPVAIIELGGDLGGSQFENHLTFLARGVERTPIESLGDESVRVERSGGTLLAVRSGHAGLFVQLTRTFSNDAATGAIEVLRARLSVMEPYAARWTERHGAD